MSIQQQLSAPFQVSLLEARGLSGSTGSGQLVHCRLLRQSIASCLASGKEAAGGVERGKRARIQQTKNVRAQQLFRQAKQYTT